VDAPAESSTEEATRLGDGLVKFMALPALWPGGEPAHIASTFLDALLGTLQLTFVVVRLNDPEGGASIEMMRVAESLRGPARPEVSLASARLGLRGEIGIVVAGSQKIDFPAETDRLLLIVAANQAALALQQAYIDDLKRAEAELRRAYDHLAEAQRLSQTGSFTSDLERDALTASIAHEVNQPLSGIITNASTCLRMLDATPPNVDGARETARRTIRDGNRASDVIARLRALFSKKAFTLESLDLNEAAREVIALWSSDLRRTRVILQSELADDLPTITGDRIQLQQVILNLLRNASDAMNDVHDRPRQLLIRTEREDADHVRVMVKDAGVGFDPQSRDKLFDAFYTTKSDGMGIGLSVSRSIIEKHHGRLWAEPNGGAGATFSFSIPRSIEGSIAASPVMRGS
jgi:signal transduction histidine kinase